MDDEKTDASSAVSVSWVLRCFIYVSVRDMAAVYKKKNNIAYTAAGYRSAMQ